MGDQDMIGEARSALAAEEADDLARLWAEVYHALPGTRERLERWLQDHLHHSPVALGRLRAIAAALDEEYPAHDAYEGMRLDTPTHPMLRPLTTRAAQGMRLRYLARKDELWRAFYALDHELFEPTWHELDHIAWKHRSVHLLVFEVDGEFVLFLRALRVETEWGDLEGEHTRQICSIWHLVASKLPGDATALVRWLERAGHGYGFDDWWWCYTAR